VKVGTRHSPRRADQANDLSAAHGISHGYQRFAHVKIGRDHAATVIYIDDVSREKEIVYQRDDAPVGGTDLFTGGSPKIDAQMSRRQLAIEHSA
jgi:hypothetical protein